MVLRRALKHFAKKVPSNLEEADLCRARIFSSVALPASLFSLSDPGSILIPISQEAKPRQGGLGTLLSSQTVTPTTGWISCSGT